MIYRTLHTEVQDGIAVITLNRPDVRNAINFQVQADLHVALDLLGDDETVGAVVFTGAGDRAFAAGADIAQLQNYTMHTGLDAAMARLFDKIESFEKPTIAAINGYALGGGCELAMSCDIRVAAPNARLGLPETMLSVLPGAGGTQRMARLIGVGRAIDLVLTGRLINATEAHAMGLVTHVSDNSVTAAQDIARGILSRGPLAIRLAKLVIRAGLDADQHTGLVIERLAQALLYTTADKGEGAAAFLSKRPAAFTGK